MPANHTYQITLSYGKYTHVIHQPFDASYAWALERLRHVSETRIKAWERAARLKQQRGPKPVFKLWHLTKKVAPKAEVQNAS